MKNLQEVIRKIEERIDAEIDLSNDPKSIDVTGACDSNGAYWVLNRFEPVYQVQTPREKEYVTKLIIDTLSTVDPFNNRVGLDKMDISVSQNGKEVAYEKFDDYDGVELNPRFDDMSRYAIEFLGEKGIDLRKDFEFHHEDGDPFWFPVIRNDFTKSRNYFHDRGIDLDLDSRILKVWYESDSDSPFPAEQRLERIMSVYNSLLNQE